MVRKSEVRKCLINFLVESQGFEESDAKGVGDTDRLYEDLNLDSLDRAQMMMYMDEVMEGKYGLKPEIDSDFDPRKVRDTIDYFFKKYRQQ